MIFPDARTRVPTPAFSAETIRTLKRRAYKTAAVELSAYPQSNFSFLRPPGWKVGPPLVHTKAPMPMPALASFTKKNPTVFMDMLTYSPSYDCLPGDFLDAHLDGLLMTHRSEGPLGDGWYADRMGRYETGHCILAGHRKGKELYLFLCAMSEGAFSRVREEVLAIVATFTLREKNVLPYAERWRRYASDKMGLSFALPLGVTLQHDDRGVSARWHQPAGNIDFSVRPVHRQERDFSQIEAGFRQDLLQRGIRLGPPRVGDLPASSTGIFTGAVSIRLYESLACTAPALETLLMVGTRKNGHAVRVMGTYPSRESDCELWMRARFAFVQIAATMRAY